MGLKFCSLASGSSGNCQWIASDKTAVLLDAGLSGKYIQAAVSSLSEDIGKAKGILVTHEHIDHMKCIGVMMRRYGLQLYANQATFDALEPKIGKYDLNQVTIFENGKPFEIGDLVISPFGISHDAVDPVAYSFSHGNRKVSIATDLGTVTEAIMKELLDADILMIEANHDVEMLKVGPYPYHLKRRILSDIGHLSNDHAGEVALEVLKAGRLQSVLLGHISKENNHPELAYETVKGVLEAEGVEIGRDIQLDMTYRDRVSRFYHMK